jgi:tellurite resistance protein
MSWWAASFPLAASAATSLRYAEYANHVVTDAIAWLLLAIASVTILAFLFTNVRGLMRGQLKQLA